AHSRRRSRSAWTRSSSHDSASHRQPFDDGIEIPVGPGTLFAVVEQPADLLVLIVYRPLRVDGDETENERERLVFADDPRDEPLVARRGLVDVGHILAGL